MTYVANLKSAGPVGNLRTTLEQIVKELPPDPIVGVSGGLDSQILLHSFCDQHISFTAAMLHLPGRNDTDLENLKLLEQKYKFELTVIQLDSRELSDYDLYKKFVSLLPPNRNFVQGLDAPVVLKRNINHKEKLFYVDSSNQPHRILNQELSTLNRTGSIVNINNDPRYISSILHDDLYSAMMHSYDYLRGNRVCKNNTTLNEAEIYRYFVRPILYAKYWDHLIYLPPNNWLGNSVHQHNYTQSSCYLDCTIYKKFLEKDNATLSVADNSSQVLGTPSQSRTERTAPFERADFTNLSKGA